MAGSPFGPHGLLKNRHRAISSPLAVVHDWPPFSQLADAVLVLHSAIALFVVGGFVAIPLGNRFGWRWVNGLLFRIVHLAAVAIVVAQAWGGGICPLTSVEMWLRAKAGAPTYSGSFVSHWFGRLLYYDAPDWVFLLAYSLLALAILAAWWYYPPRKKRR